MLAHGQDEIARIDEVRDRRREKTCRGEETSRNRGSDRRRAQLGIPHVHLTDFLSPDAVIAGFGNSIRGLILRKSPDHAGIAPDRVANSTVSFKDSSFAASAKDQ